jgi:hypothetical protein
MRAESLFQSGSTILPTLEEEGAAVRMLQGMLLSSLRDADQPGGTLSLAAALGGAYAARTGRPPHTSIFVFHILHLRDVQELI